MQNPKRIANILRALDDAERPEDLNLPGFRFHALAGREPGMLPAVQFNDELGGVTREVGDYRSKGTCRRNFAP